MRAPEAYAEYRQERRNGECRSEKRGGRCCTAVVEVEEGDRRTFDVDPEGAV